MLRKVSCRKQFNDRFSKRVTNTLSEAEVEVKVVPKQAAKKRNKFALSSTSSGEKMFWEELRDSRVRRFEKPSVGRKKYIEIESMEFLEEIVPVNPVSKKSVPTIVSENSVSDSLSPVERYLEPSQQLLQLHPSLLSTQTDIVRAKTTADILAILEGENELLPLITGLHCLARLASRKRSETHLEVVRSDHRFDQILDKIGFGIPSMGVVGKSHTFWSLVKLGVYRQTRWADQLVESLVKDIPHPHTPSDIITNTFFSVAELLKTSTGSIGKESRQQLDVLSDACISTLSARIPDLTTKDLISTCTSLARVGRPEPVLMTALGDRLVDKLDSVSFDELSTVLWSFTSLKLIDSALYTKIQKMLESRPPTDCSKRHLVDLVWALAKGRPSTADHSLSELFRFTLAPLLRTHLMDFTVRELCTVLWSYASAEVVDSDFYNDIAHALIPKGSEMNAHDVSSVVWGLSAVQFAQKDLLKTLRRQAYVVKGDFTPLQLSRVVFGFGSAGVNDHKLMASLIDLCREKLHLLYTQNIVEILMGMDGCGMLGNGLEDAFLETLAGQVQRISGRDAVQILKLLPKDAKHRELKESLLEIVKARFNCSGRWIPNGYDLCDLLEAISRLKIEDPNVIEPALVHLGTVYKSPSFTPDLFLRFLSAVSGFDRTSNARKTLSKLLLLKEKGIQVAVARLAEDLLKHTDHLSVEGAVDILELFALTGFSDQTALKLAELISDSIVGGERVGAELRVRISASLAQLQIMPNFAFQLIESLGIHGLTDQAVVDVVWARLALGDDVGLLPEALVERLLDVETVEQEFRLQQVALSLSKIEEEKFENFSKKWVEKSFSNQKSIKLENPRSITRSMDKYESLISFALSELGVKHAQKVPVFRGLYWVTATIGPNICIDLVGPEDVVAPKSDKWKGEKILKKIHLIADGWTVVSVTMRQVQSALESNSLKPMVADLIAPYNEKGRQRSTFKQIPENVKSLVSDILEK
jgi:hypothetical protein